MKEIHYVLTNLSKVVDHLLDEPSLFFYNRAYFCRRRVIMKEIILGIAIVVLFRGRNVSALIRPFRRNLSVATFTHTKLLMGSNYVSPLPALVKKASSKNRTDRMDALETLSSIIYDDDDDEDDDDEGDLSESMGSKELGLLPSLVSIISLDGIMARETALAILAMTSIYSLNHRYMLSLELALVPVLASVLSSDASDSSDYCR